MSVATFNDKLTSSGARLASYRGAETPASALAIPAPSSAR